MQIQLTFKQALKIPDLSLIDNKASEDSVDCAIVLSANTLNPQFHPADDRFERMRKMIALRKPAFDKVCALFRAHGVAVEEPKTYIIGSLSVECSVDTLLKVIEADENDEIALVLRGA